MHEGALVFVCVNACVCVCVISLTVFYKKECVQFFIFICCCMKEYLYACNFMCECVLMCICVLGCFFLGGRVLMLLRV